MQNKGLAGFIIGNAKSVLIVFALLGVAAGYFASQFKINASADTLLLKDNKLYIETQVMNQRSHRKNLYYWPINQRNMRCLVNKPSMILQV